MDLERFKQAENEYFRLKGLFVAGRMTQQQFEDALKPLVIQDEQGRHWMLGVDDAKWYVHDGKSWVQADPPGGATPVALATGAPPSPPRQGSQFPLIVLAGGIVLICICGVVGIFFAATQGLLRIGPSRPPTAFIMPTPFVFPTPILFSTPFVTPLPPIPPMPAATVLPTATPTLTPTSTLMPTATLTPTLTATPTLTPKPQGNCADPSARWENVVDGQTLDPYHAFIGTANGPNFAGYVVEWLRPGNVLHRSATPVTHGVIFVWNTFTVENGVYPVALTVVLNDGTTLAPCVVQVRVAR